MGSKQMPSVKRRNVNRVTPLRDKATRESVIGIRRAALSSLTQADAMLGWHTFVLRVKSEKELEAIRNLAERLSQEMDADTLKISL